MMHTGQLFLGMKMFHITNNKSFTTNQYEIASLTALFLIFSERMA